MIKKEKNIILCVGKPTGQFIDDIRRHQKVSAESFQIMLLLPKNSTKIQLEDKVDFVCRVDFQSQIKLAEVLLPYQERLLAVTVAAVESSVPLLAKVIPHVPYLRTPTAQSLIWSTDKYEMRKRLKVFLPEHIPAFTKVNNATKKEIERVIERVGFPMVVKPANLAASSFVTVNYHRQELEENLRKIFKSIAQTYKKGERGEEPKIISEEYMEGLMFSIDSYVNGRGEVVHAPMVRVKTGKDIGYDDFHNYLRITPTGLKKDSIAAAEKVTENAVRALGLRHSTAHTELMRVDNDWKIIEVGARQGGYRAAMYNSSCDINHTMNDVFVRIPRKVIIPKTCKGYSAVLQKFAKKEGVILEMKGVKKIEDLDSFDSLIIKKKIGDKAQFAKNGGKSIFNLHLYNADRSKLLADIRRVEQMVEIKVAARGAVKKEVGDAKSQVSKKAPTKTAQ
jgi:hypothetical protein